MIYVIEKIWVDSWENRDAYGYEPVGYVSTETEALKICASEFREPKGWPLETEVEKGRLPNPVPVYRYKTLDQFKPQ